MVPKQSSFSHRTPVVLTPLLPRRSRRVLPLLSLPREINRKASAEMIRSCEKISAPDALESRLPEQNSPVRKESSSPMLLPSRSSSSPPPPLRDDISPTSSVCSVSSISDQVMDITSGNEGISQTLFGPSSVVATSPARAIVPPFLAHKFVALDAEFVGIGPGGYESALARVTLVDFNGTLILDTHVKVNEPVTDYRTFVSGIREEHLTSPTARDFEDVRAEVQKLLMHKVLVGHGLENDLKVLRISVPWYNRRDTSLYKRFMKLGYDGLLRPSRLRDLARQHLGIMIQQDGQPHDSFQDACAAMALYRMVQRDWDAFVDWNHRQAVLQHVPMAPRGYPSIRLGY